MPIPSWFARLALVVGVIFALYLCISYVLLPKAWKFVDRGVVVGPGSMVTRTASGIPGDPINVGLVGDVEAVLRAFAAAGWDTADAVTLKTAVEIGVSVLFDRPYPDAPVSPLIYEGRHQDLAFEKPVGESADARHHVRFWRTGNILNGRPLWLGAASFDRGVGLSRDTGQITHHIAPEIDAERDTMMRDLESHKQITSTYTIAGVGSTHGRNGEGDTYFTDGNALIGHLILASDCN